MQPGYVVVSEEPSLLCSVSGNGVIITLWDRAGRVGGMAHCIFFKANPREKTNNYCVDTAVPLLVKQISGLNPRENDLEAQIFGGGSRGIWNKKRAVKLISTAKKIFKRLNIAIVSEDIGGSLGRKVIFDTFRGEAMVLKTKKVRKTDWFPEYSLQPNT